MLSPDGGPMVRIHLPPAASRVRTCLLRNAEETEDHGTVYETRTKKMREQIAAMTEIWTKDKPEHHGEFVSFPPMMTWPKPSQKPHPPIIVVRLPPRRAARDPLSDAGPQSARG